MADSLNKKDAQSRVDRIRAFREELRQLHREGVLDLSGDQQSKVDDYLRRTLADLAAVFDVDVSESQKKISLGMRILSTLGGLAFCAALVLFFYRIWGMLPTPMQVVILIAAPVIGLISMEFVAPRERTPYYTALLGLVVIASFILNLTVLGSLFNLIPSKEALLAWGAFALVIAYRYRLRIPLAIALTLLIVYLAATGVAWSGGDWIAMIERPESFIPVGLASALLPLAFRHRRLTEFPEIYRLLGLLFLFFSLLAMMHGGNLSYFPLAGGKVESIYHIVGFVAAGLTIWIGIKHSLLSLVNLGSASFAVFLFDRLISWWWDWMPKYLIFLIIGLIALFLMAAFRKLRARTKEQMI